MFLTLIELFQITNSETCKHEVQSRPLARGKGKEED